MSFAIIADTATNLPAAQLAQRDIIAVPLEFYLDGVAHTCLSVVR